MHNSSAQPKENMNTPIAEYRPSKQAQRDREYVEKIGAQRQATHSPLPWESIGNGTQIIKRDGYMKGSDMTICHVPPMLDESENPDAAYIVRACNNAERLADDMREIRDMAAKRSRVNMQNGVSLEAFARCSLAQWELAQ
jgi:hypothetical protein